MVNAYFRPVGISCIMSPVQDFTEFAMMHTTYKIQFHDERQLRIVGFRLERFINYVTKYVDMQLKMLGENRMNLR